MEPLSSNGHARMSTAIRLYRAGVIARKGRGRGIRNPQCSARENPGSVRPWYVSHRTEAANATTPSDLCVEGKPGDTRRKSPKGSRGRSDPARMDVESTREETAGVRPALDEGVSSTPRYL